MYANIIPVATGEKWIGSGVRSSYSVVMELIGGAREQLVLTAYVLTNMDVVNNIIQVLDRGVRVTIYLYDNSEENTIDEAVRQIIEVQKEYSYLKVKIVRTKVLHAKVIVADSRKVLVGSANFTHYGLKRNYELGFLVEDAEIAGRILSLIGKVGE
jgi:phosphatidylserine/phosphatidylglycerophosphate/cardiolipin synthase-like enzyme